MPASPRRRRQYHSKEFHTPDTDPRLRVEIDRIPPWLYRAVRREAQRAKTSVRHLTLRLWAEWLAERTPPDTETR